MNREPKIWKNEWIIEIPWNIIKEYSAAFSACKLSVSLKYSYKSGAAFTQRLYSAQNKLMYNWDKGRLQLRMSFVTLAIQTLS